MILLFDSRIVQFDKAAKIQKESTDAIVNYWNDFALYSSFEYWILAGILVIPLIILFFKIDKSKIFQIGFFGYSIHVFFAYMDIYGINVGFWHYPIQLIPSLPSLSIDSSLVPVTFMLVYQWTLNRNKNYYVYSIIAAAILSFGFNPILVQMGLLKMYGKINYFHLFITYITVLILAKLITNGFVWMKKRYRRADEAF
jgi:hypothetical protein